MERETHFMDLVCYLLCVAQNPDAVLPDTLHGSASLLIAALIGELSNTEPNALKQQTAVPTSGAETSVISLLGV